VGRLGDGAPHPRAGGGWTPVSATRASSRHPIERFGFLHDPEGRRRRGRRIVAALADFGGIDVAGARVLDIGCSAGLITREIAGAASFVIGIDVDIDAVRHAVNGSESAQFAVASGVALPFSDASFDAVVCNHVYEHVADAKALMREIRRVLRAGGVCYLAAGHTLQLIEPHYRLPLLSWLPRSVASAWLRAAGRGDRYVEKFLPPWRLRSLGDGFVSIRLVSPQMLRAPARFEFPQLVALPAPARRMIAAASAVAARLAPTWIFILRR
jgi:2-polyprenyl-3-methyl-5-hydroxy-6-metoxy-1,4-benzoquinol methylase